MSICLQQCDCQTEEWINPSDPPKLFGWQSSSRLELLKVCEISSNLCVFFLMMIDVLMADATFSATSEWI